MNYNDLDMDEITKLLQDFFKKNPSFTDPELDKAKILYDEQKNNLVNWYSWAENGGEKPLLLYDMPGYGAVRISEKFRGVLINDKWVIYCGERKKYYWNIYNFDPSIENWFSRYPRQGTLNFTTNSKQEEYSDFASPNMVDITEYFFKPSRKFINWNELPWGDLK